MPDISMCKNNTCPSRKSCYRYTAETNPNRQTYNLFEVKKGKDKCLYYWDKEIKYTQSGYEYWILNPKKDDK